MWRLWRRSPRSPPAALADVLSFVGPEEAKALVGIPPGAVVGSFIDGAKAGQFVPNPIFTALLHEVVGRLVPQEAASQAEAARQGQGYLYIIDQRTPDPRGEVPSIDIIGWFRIEDGRIAASDYEPNETYRTWTEKGMFRVSAPVMQGLRQAAGMGPMVG